MTSLLAPRALARAVMLLALALLAAAPAQAVLRTYQVRWVPQGSVVADGYDLHLRLDGSNGWSVIDLGFVPTNASGLAIYPMLLNDTLDYDLALSAYVLDGARKLSSPLSNVVGVVALEEIECAVDADCSDGNVCNGSERCLAGACSAGAALVCADPGPCQAAVCDAVQGCLVMDDPADPACQPAPDPEPDPGPDPQLDGVSIDLDGNGEQLGTSGATTLGVATEFTLSMWVKPTGLQASQYLFQAFSPGTSARRSAILVVAQNEKPNDPIRLVTYKDTGDLLQTRDYDHKQRTGEWLHIVMVQPPGGDHLYAYFDGVSAQPNAIKADSSGSMTDRPREIVLGSDFTRLQQFFRGAIGHVALWNRQLTAAEVAEIHARGHDIDLRSNTGAYVSASRLRHYWRLGEIPSALGTDFVPTAPVHLNQTVGLDASDVVPDAP